MDFGDNVTEIVKDGRLALRISLWKQKKIPEGAVLIRACTYPQDQLLCPVHALRELVKFQKWERRGRIFALNPTGCGRLLRTQIIAAGTAAESNADEYSSHGFLRGTAQDII